MILFDILGVHLYHLKWTSCKTVSTCPHWAWLPPFQDEDDEIYSSIQQLRDQSEELQSRMEEIERSGDNAGAERIRSQLNDMEARLLERNQERQERHRASRLVGIQKGQMAFSY